MTCTPTWKPIAKTALGGALALLACALAPTPAFAQEDIFAVTEPVMLDPSNPARTTLGELKYRGGVAIEPGDEGIGGISGLEWKDDRLYAVSDDGHWLTILPSETNGTLIDAFAITRGPLLDERGKKLRNKEDADAEAITWVPGVGWWVSFERDHRIWRYEDLTVKASDPMPGVAGQIAFMQPMFEALAPNGGIETLAAGPDTFVACAEFSSADKDNCVRADANGEPTFFRLAAPAPLAEHGGAPTGAACAQDATCYILMRSYKPDYGNRAAIIELAPDLSQKTLALFDAPLTRDNFEGLALREEPGRRYLYVVSDDNFNNCAAKDQPGCQRTLLMKFEIMIAEPPPPPADVEPTVEYETLPIVIQTELGDIKVALETERAPVTTANFLRYIDEDRFDGTVFYRSMKQLDRDPQPNGLIQGGTQNDPKRILPGIPHEPTSETGLTHTNGALSMAMGEPGTANGDFSIMVQDQIGLDARPDSDKAIWRNGYAVFGYVTEGMEIVAQIHARPGDPNKGEGFMQGQILADPVTIIDVRRDE